MDLRGTLLPKCTLEALSPWYVLSNALIGMVLAILPNFIDMLLVGLEKLEPSTPHLHTTILRSPYSSMPGPHFTPYEYSVTNSLSLSSSSGRSLVFAWVLVSLQARLGPLFFQALRALGSLVSPV